MMYGVTIARGCTAAMAPASRSHSGPVLGETGDGSLGSTASMRTCGSRIALRRCSSASATDEPTAMRTFTTASAVSGRAFAARLPRSCVTAVVVRTIARVSSLILANTARSSGCSRRARTKTARSGPVACAPRVSTIRRVVSLSRAGNGFAFTRVIARASRTVAVVFGGVDACPPCCSTVSRTLVMPFSLTPTTAIGFVTPGKMRSTTAPPSSSTKPGRTPRSRRTPTSACAPEPTVSSSCPKLRYTSDAGAKPSATSASTASRIATTAPLSSSVPRPQSRRPSPLPVSSAANGGCVQPSSVAGTTS